jgi:hypothetical protein
MLGCVMYISKLVELPKSRNINLNRTFKVGVYHCLTARKVDESKQHTENNLTRDFPYIAMARI